MKVSICPISFSDHVEVERAILDKEILIPSVYLPVPMRS